MSIKIFHNRLGLRSDFSTIDRIYHRSIVASFLMARPFHSFDLVMKANLGGNRAGFEGLPLMARSKHKGPEIDKKAVSNSIRKEVGVRLWICIAGVILWRMQTKCLRKCAIEMWSHGQL